MEIVIVLVEFWERAVLARLCSATFGLETNRNRINIIEMKTNRPFLLFIIVSKSNHNLSESY